MIARNISLRRSLQQALHCLQEALSVIDNKEDPRCALDDVEQAHGLLTGTAIPSLQARVRGAEASLARMEVRQELREREDLGELGEHGEHDEHVVEVGKVR